MPLQVAAEIFEAIDLIKLFPHMGTPLQDEWRGFRKITVRCHRLLYELAANAEQIIISQLRFPGMR